MLQEQLSIPACFSSGTDDPSAVTKSGQNVFMSVYRTKIADQCRLITVTWCKNMLLHGLAVSVEGPEGERQYICKVELKPWYFWKKQGSKRFLVDSKPIDVFWDLKSAKFNGETEPGSNYYVAIVCDDEVVLLLGNLRKEAYRKTMCRPSLIDPILISKKEHIFGKRKFISRVKFHDKGSFHDISIECKNRISNNATTISSSSNGRSSNGVEPEMEIQIDGHLVIHVKHLQWKFRGNESIHLNNARIEVYWDVHDWLFSPGLRHALFIFRPTLLSTSLSLGSTPLSSQTRSSGSTEGSSSGGCAPDFCLFLYAWKLE